MRNYSCTPVPSHAVARRNNPRATGDSFFSFHRGHDTNAHMQPDFLVWFFSKFPISCTPAPCMQLHVPHPTRNCKCSNPRATASARTCVQLGVSLFIYFCFLINFHHVLRAWLFYFSLAIEKSWKKEKKKRNIKKGKINMLISADLELTKFKSTEPQCLLQPWPAR